LITYFSPPIFFSCRLLENIYDYPENALVCFTLNIRDARVRTLCLKLHMSPNLGIEIGKYLGWRGMNDDNILYDKWEESNCCEATYVLWEEDCELDWLEDGIDLYLNLDAVNKKGPFLIYMGRKKKPMDLRDVITGMEEVCKFFEKELPNEFYSFYVIPADMAKKNSFFLIVRVRIQLIWRQVEDIWKRRRVKWACKLNAMWRVILNEKCGIFPLEIYSAIMSFVPPKYVLTTVEKSNIMESARNNEKIGKKDFLEEVLEKNLTIFDFGGVNHWVDEDTFDKWESTKKRREFRNPNWNYRGKRPRKN